MSAPPGGASKHIDMNYFVLLVGAITLVSCASQDPEDARAVLTGFTYELREYVTPSARCGTKV